MSFTSGFLAIVEAFGYCPRILYIDYNRRSRISPFVFIVTLGVKVKESKFQAGLIKEIKDMLVDAVVLKNDSSYQQGFPDLLVLHPNGWAVLEVKKSLNEPYQPNQEYFLDLLDGWSIIGLGRTFSAMICPENKEDILDELYKTLVRR